MQNKLKLVDGCWVTVADAARETGANERQLRQAVAAHFIRGAAGPGGVIYIHAEELMGIRRSIEEDREARNLAGAIFHDAAGRELDTEQAERERRRLLGEHGR